MAFRLGRPRLGKTAQKFDPVYLPAEIFSNIVSIACQHDNQIYTHMFPLVFASVNQSWRSFILDSPHIWTSLCVDLSGPVSMNGVHKFLERSRSLPLDVFLYNSETEGQEETISTEAPLVTALLQALDPQIGRWRSFQLHLGTNRALSDAICSLRGVAKSLEELIIGGHGIFGSIDFSIRRPIIRMAMPAIRRLQISGCAVSWFHEDKRVNVTYPRKLYQHREGRFFGIRPKDFSAGVPLEVLEFGASWTVERFPKLRTIRFTGPYNIGGYMRFIESCEHLVVSGIHDIAWTLDQLGFFHDSTSYPSMVLWYDNFHEPPSQAEGWFCPRLRSLEIYHCDGLDPTQLRDVLTARQNATGPGSLINAITSLIVHDEQELPGDDRAWFEANPVAFQW
ncbi:hypothetical protein BD779DRAFT_1787830 [Infundibulicybe gibba]|nr:hypothetical protein BD779DRAFT_1787830 [Infundibulicybe gibba]